MSTDGRSQDDEVRRGWFSGQSANSPRTILLIVICTVVGFVVLRWTVLRPLADAAKMAVENKKYQQELGQRLDSTEKDAESTTEHLSAMKSELKGKDVDLQKMLKRVEKMQKAFLETAKDIEQVKWQAKDVEASRARSLAGARRIKARAIPIQQKLKALRQSIQAWSKQVTPLFQNEAGRRIAANPDHMKRFLLIPKNPPATLTQVAIWEQSLEDLLNPVNIALDQDKGAFRTVDKHLTELEKLATDIENAAESVAGNLREAQRLTEETKDVLANKQTLTQAIKTLNDRQEKTDRAAIVASSQAAREEATIEAKRIVAEAAKRVVVAEQDVQLQKKQQEEFEKKAEAEQLRQSNAALAKALKHSRLLGEYGADLPEIKNLLRSFITPALMKISERGFSRSGNAIRMSLARIKGYGAMEDTDEGLERLHYLGGSTANWRQDHGSFPVYKKLLIKRDESVRKQVRRAQKLLAKYGEILVEKGLLSE